MALSKHEMLSSSEELTGADSASEAYSLTDSIKDFSSSLPSTQLTSDGLRNFICYDYFVHLQAAIPQAKKGIKKIVHSERFQEISLTLIKNLKTIESNIKIYNPEFNYGDLYTDYMLKFEAFLTEFLPSVTKKSEQFDGDENLENLITKEKLENDILALAHLSFENRNRALEIAIYPFLNEKYTKVNQTVESFSKAIKKKLADHHPVNKLTPLIADAWYTRLFQLRGRYQPQTLTSIPSVQLYSWKIGADADAPIEIRCGTQAEYIDGHARVNPLFSAYLIWQNRHSPKPITHIYFNDLPRNRFDSIEGPREVGATLALEELENTQNNVMIITLPADKGRLDRRLLKEHIRKINVQESFHTILETAMGKESDVDHQTTIRDFYISDSKSDTDTKEEATSFGKIGSKQIIYTDEDGNYIEEKILTKLILNSFRKLGFLNREKISLAEEQAVYFHFIKYELKNYIIEKIKPDSINFSCKDGIDRGGISRLYYNLIKSIETGKCLTEEEFFKGLHAATILVKGRSLNHHILTFWNALNEYINGQLGQDKTIPEWLIQWRDTNTPKVSKEYILNEGIEKLKEYIKLKDREYLTPTWQDRLRFVFKGEADRTPPQIKKAAAEELIKILNGLKTNTLSNETIYFKDPRTRKALVSDRLFFIFSEIAEIPLVDDWLKNTATYLSDTRASCLKI